MCANCQEMCEQVSEEMELPFDLVFRINENMKRWTERKIQADVLADEEESARVLATLASFSPEMAAAIGEPEILNDAEPIPSALMSMLVASVGGPVVVVAARPLGEEGASITIKTAGTNDLNKTAITLLRTALETMESPLSQTGGMTEDGRMVFPTKGPL